MAHPRQLIEALMKRFMKSKKGSPVARDSRDMDTFPDEGQYYGSRPDEISQSDWDHYLRTIADEGKVKQRRALAAQPDDPLKQPVESGLSRYLPEENIHEPMMPRTRDGSPRTRDRTRLPDSSTNENALVRSEAQPTRIDEIIPPRGPIKSEDEALEVMGELIDIGDPARGQWPPMFERLKAYNPSLARKVEIELGLDDTIDQAGKLIFDDIPF